MRSRASVTPRVTAHKVVLLSFTITVAGVLAGTAAGTASAARGGGGSAHRGTDTRTACATAHTTRHAQCMALIRTDVAPRRALAAATVPTGFGPADLQSAYHTPSATAGAGRNVYIVDAYDYTTAEADLNAYRSQYGLPACTTASGCFHKVNQDGQTGPLPGGAGGSGWDVEAALDIQMVSAVCPLCHITLVEANSDSISDLGAAENGAVALGAKYISNSWGTDEYDGELADDATYFTHPGVAITVSAGDTRGTFFPASSQHVIAVGGTSLSRADNARGWTESAWGEIWGNISDGTGQGCSKMEPKPAWQHDKNCAMRSQNDVSAVADPDSGVAVYNTSSQDGWLVVGGTSVSSPMIASMYALAGTPAPGTNPAQYIYQHSGDFTDVTTGASNDCSGYLCNAKLGYDGPTGWGTPDGVLGLSPGGNRISIASAGRSTVTVGDRVSFQITATDSAPGQRLTYRASHLPDGLSINPSTGLITGTASTASVQQVAISASDTTGETATAYFTFTVNPVGGPHTITVRNPGDQSGRTFLGPLTLQIHAIDSAAGETLTYTQEGLPAVMRIDPATGLISGSLYDQGTLDVTVTVTDSTGASASAEFHWTVTLSP